MMLSKKVIAVIAVALAATLTAGVFAGLMLSNNLTANFTVVNNTPQLALSFNPNSPDTGTFNVGVWYPTGVELKNTGSATFNNVLVHFTITTGPDIPENSIQIQYYSGTWLNLPLTGWGTGTVSGTFGPGSGFPVGVGYDVITPLQFMFEGNASLSSYNLAISAQTVP